jgi:hypothetical protein
MLSLITVQLGQDQRSLSKERAMKPLLLATVFAVLATSAFSAVPARAQTLREDAHVTEKLVAAQAGDILRNACPKARARMFVVFGEMMSLKSYAKSQGYDEPTVKAFLADKAEKKRIRQLANAYLAKAGFIKGDEASACATARAEVASATFTGSLLRVAN